MKRFVLFLVVLTFIPTCFASTGSCEFNISADAQDDFTTSDMSFDILGIVSVDSEGLAGLDVSWSLDSKPDGAAHDMVQDISDIFNPEASLTVNMQGQYTFNLLATSGACVALDTITVTVIPEPATVTLLAAGIFGLFGLRRRR